MKKLSFLFVPLLLCTFFNDSLAQKRTLNINPPPSMNSDDVKPSTEPADSYRRIDLLQLQKEADDLARTAQTIPSDMASVRRGTLPKDVILKLKQIEKLSKHLRSELNP